MAVYSCGRLLTQILEMRMISQLFSHQSSGTVRDRLPVAGKALMTDVTAGAWDIDEGIRDAERFFALLPSMFPTATLFFAEGTSVARDVQQCYERFADPGPFLPGRDTVWPCSQTFRCSTSPAFFQALSVLSAQHANPEILDHLSLYERDRMIFHWHDAFANAIQLDGALPESTIAALAKPFGCHYERV